MTRQVWLGACALLLCAAGPPGTDPDWPCVQRLVPVVTAGSLWSGHTDAGDWRADPAIAEVVAAIAPRNRPVETGSARLEAYIATVPPADRPAKLAQVFTGLVDQTNFQRTQAIERLRAVARRQRVMTEGTSRVTAELRALTPDTPAATREELVSRRTLMIREYEEVGRIIQYSCEVPVQLESRLGQFLQVLQRGLPD